MPRIWHQSVNELDHLDVYKRALEAHAAEILGGDAEVVVHGLPSGSYGGASATAVLGNAFAYHRTLDRVIDYAITAERQGYDAFVIGSFSEPFLREIRSAVDIPVASLTESGLLVGCSLGSYLALVSNAPAVHVDARRSRSTSTNLPPACLRSRRWIRRSTSRRWRALTPIRPPLSPTSPPWPNAWWRAGQT